MVWKCLCVLVEMRCSTSGSYGQGQVVQHCGYSGSMMNKEQDGPSQWTVLCYLVSYILTACGGIIISYTD